MAWVLVAVVGAVFWMGVHLVGLAADWALWMMILMRLAYLTERRAG